MKKSVLLFLSFFMVMFLYAQSPPGKWMIKKVGVSLGQDMDMINGLDYQYLLSTSDGGMQSRYGDLQFPEQDLYGGVCENPYVRAYMTLGIPGLDKFNFDVAAVGIFNRFDGLYYYNEKTGGNLDVQSQTNEVSLEAELARQLNVARWFKLYGGLGTNIGYNFGGTLSVVEYEMETGEPQDYYYAQNSERSAMEVFGGEVMTREDNTEITDFKVNDGISQRVFATMGFGFVMGQRIELGAFFRRGIGYRNIFGAESKKINLHSAGLRLNYLFGSKCCLAK